MKTGAQKKMILSALFIALTFVATSVIKIPSPTSGYANLGDCMVLLGAFLLGPIYGSLAGGLGSMLADVLSPYAFYAPGTFVIKGVTALVAVLLFRRLKEAVHPVFAAVICGIVGECFMVVGYFFYSSTILGYGLAAAANIPGDGFQALVGIAVSSLLYVRLIKIPFIQKVLGEGDRNGSSNYHT